MFEQYSHEPYIAVARFWALFDVTPSDEQRAGEDALGQPRSSCPGRSSERRHFLVADRYTIADIALYAYTHVANEGGFDVDAYPAIGPWLERVAAQPGHVQITD